MRRLEKESDLCRADLFGGEGTLGTPRFDEWVNFFVDCKSGLPDCASLAQFGRSPLFDHIFTFHCGHQQYCCWSYVSLHARFQSP